ncbi:autotransporter outer membrane beta-barrel domain-containing protein [Kingella negevensis]|uniref:autotransporter outer membrane beta-barrel domain-containing protein n=1 Tax=Kingella negevensis TaxID=1522312 RepID=UPI002543C342|nr:autotransporter outer membrane beta-barrel domain-containing protein [Kingella negevensis]WII94296.1 autotransporter outer membrane beta-barrel domain-containing protein [Kingella negevensis]
MPYNVWLDVSAQNNEYGSNNYRGYEQDLLVQQLGVEKGFGDTNSIRGGAILTHSYADNDFDENASGKSRNINFTTYGKYITSSDWFIAGDVGYLHNRNQIALDGESIKFNRNAYFAGLSAGKDLQAGGFEIQPSVGLHYYRFDDSDYILKGAHVQTSALDLLTYRVGLKVQRPFNVGGVTLVPSLSSSYVDTSNNNAKVRVNGN